jgi:hypothetical protein
MDPNKSPDSMNNTLDKSAVVSDPLQVTPAYISDKVDWMELEAENVTGQERKNLLAKVALEWQRFYGLSDKVSVLEHFLDGFLTTEARIQRGVALAGEKNMQMVLAALEPLSMALGSPEAPIPEFWRQGPWPPRQSDFDKRLADWTRSIILTKNTTALRLFCDALDRIPTGMLRIEVDFDEFVESLNLSKQSTNKEAKKSPLSRYFDAFFRIFIKYGRLPTKGELDAEADVLDPGDCKTYRRKLGLRNLPRKGRRS